MKAAAEDELDNGDHGVILDDGFVVKRAYVLDIRGASDHILMGADLGMGRSLAMGSYIF